ncbi:MAG: 2-oxo-4-hydroxy-4-carboxy-5-ureidoimidazoline decarboxylase [Opitutus sp.]
MTTIESLNLADRAEFVRALGHLFEHSPWVADQTWDRRPFQDVAHLHRELCATMYRAPVDQQRALIEAHPDLAGRLALAGKLTAESTREQASAGLDRMSTEAMEAFQKLNTAYRDRFGFPFIICARLNARDAILQAMRSRIHHSPTEEHMAALVEIEKIAELRLQDVLTRSAN